MRRKQYYNSAFYRSVEDANLDILESAVAAANGNRSEAARQLGLERANFSRIEGRLKRRKTARANMERRKTDRRQAA